MTPDCFQVTLGTNMMGCAHLTYGLLPQIIASPTGRIVTVHHEVCVRCPAVPARAPNSHRERPLPPPLPRSSWYAADCSPAAFALRLKDVGGRKDESTAMDRQYNESKALQTLWTEALQLALRAESASAHVLVASANPGAVLTDIFDVTKAQPSCFMWFVRNIATKIITVRADRGAMPLLACATSPLVASHPGLMFGAPGPGNDGLKLRLFALPKKLFNGANRDLAFKAINAELVASGREVPKF